MLHVSPSTITSPASVASSTSYFLSSASTVLSCFVCLLFSSQSVWMGERKKTVTATKAYLVSSVGQAGHDPIGLWSIACIISGIMWTGLDRSYPHASSLFTKHQKFSITPKSTKVLRNLSINFIWIGLWDPNDFTLRVGRENWLRFLCFAFSEGMFSPFMLSFYMKTTFHLFHCSFSLKPPFVAVRERSLTLESVSIGSISCWDYLTQPSAMLLSDYFGEGWKWRSISLPFRSDL